MIYRVFLIYLVTIYHTIDYNILYFNLLDYNIITCIKNTLYFI